jgi:hypothetical protein
MGRGNKVEMFAAIRWDHRNEGLAPISTQEDRGKVSGELVADDTVAEPGYAGVLGEAGRAQDG